MQASVPDQLHLLDLQEIDTEIARLRHAASSLPELAELAVARKEHQAVSQELVAAETQVSDLELAERKAEEDVVPVRERLARDERQVADGSVTDPKALSGLLGEIEHLKKRIGDLEDAQLEVMERLEAARSAAETAAAEKARIAADGRRLTATRNEKAAAFADQVSQQEAARGELVGALPTDLLALYERIRTKNGGVGAALLQRGRCGGCTLQLTNEEMSRIRATGADELVRCPECDRILVRTAESGL
ncbi:zinc ribbon domain-containing protein [Propionicicella superfundia]|uniref:zinc ribbon domain-containing protein n=1 Tax=Propionicicella superfundia TaxID=348582 RepID=UPI0003FA1BFB|nr:C4-type zinc ribbon domain-containing protein [Propionicicella superfundia]